MIEPKEAANALYGISRLARLDDSAFALFNATEQGFWRSFTAAVVIAPLQVIYQAAVYFNLETRPSGLRMFLIESLEYVVMWTLYPLVLFYVARLLEKEATYFRYIVAYNWFQMGVGLVATPLAILMTIDILPVTALAFLNTLILTAYVVYATYVARSGLGVALSGATGIVMIDILLSLAVQQTTQSMLF